MPENLDFPLAEIAESAGAVIDDGGTVYQKFSCQNCGKRLTMDVPNVLYKSGRCDDCGHVTDIEAQGCNFLAHFTA